MCAETVKDELSRAGSVGIFRLVRIFTLQVAQLEPVSICINRTCFMLIPFWSCSTLPRGDAPPDAPTSSGACG